MNLLKRGNNFNKKTEPNICDRLFCFYLCSRLDIKFAAKKYGEVAQLVRASDS